MLGLVLFVVLCAMGYAGLAILGVFAYLVYCIVIAISENRQV